MVSSEVEVVSRYRLSSAAFERDSLKLFSQRDASIYVAVLGGLFETADDVRSREVLIEHTRMALSALSSVVDDRAA